MFGGGKLATGFGATTGNNMFGGGAATTGFGANNTAAASNPFASNTSTGFGASNAVATNNTGFGANNAVSNNTGTGSVPFQAWTEREPTGSVTSHYQSITFQEPYKNKSFEELRVEDYLQGRKVGNTNGQAGTFGASTGFGGSTFGNNTSAAPATGGLFGSTNNTTTSTTGGFGGFGTNNSNNNNTTTTGGFGNNAGGGLFGAKPATGGLFGASTSQPSTGFGNTAASTGGGGLFGGGNTGGFGATNNNTTNTTGGLFGNNAAQSKPAFGGFGTNASAPTTSGFGATNTASTGGGLFGNNTNSTATGGGGLFGNNTQSQPASNPFGSSTNNTSGGGLFGAKPAATGGLFGSTSTGGNTGGGLFGGNNTAQNNNNQPQQGGGGLFGSNTTNNTGGGGLFGSSTLAKPAGGLFGSSTTAATGGSSLFGGGGNNNAQPAGSSLFGNSTAGGSLFGNNQNKPATGGLFGGAATTGNNTSSLFGGNNTQTTQQSSGTSLFGGNNQNTQNNNSNSMFGSSFGQTNNNNNGNSQSQLHANLTVSPYGNDQLFSSLASASTPVGPLATPLAGARPTPSKTQSLLSSTRLNSPLYTPRASAVGRNPGYGFSYSTYGTPGSAYSVSVTPQASSLLKPTGSLGSALTSRLAKSMSMNNLRNGDSTPREGESLLRPTPGSASSRYLSSGNMRKLTIDRSLRTDFFSPPTEQKQPEHRQLEAARDHDAPALGKKVSFDESTRSSTAEATAQNALVRTEEPDEDHSPPTLYRASEKTPANGTPEMSQVNGGSLHTVFEDGEPRRPASAPGHRSAADVDALVDVETGDYWTKPSMKDLKNMGREQLKKLGGLTVGRAGVGRIEFSACDLSNTDLDEICGRDNGTGIVHLKPRSATVYPNESAKPARGKGLNVPSKIFLDNSWPKSHGGKRAVMANSGPAYDKHVRRLKKTGGTKFIDYDAQTGTWSFSVEHFTTYELDDSDDDELTLDMEEQQDSSGLSDAPATPGHEDDTMQSIETGGTGNGEMDDTFEFKINQRSLSSVAGARVPGGFDESHVSYDYDDPSADEDINEDFMMSGGLSNAVEDPFASPRGAVQAPSPQAYERFQSSMLDEHAGAVQLAEDTQNEPEPELPGSFMPEEPKLLRSILKPSARASAFASPQKLATETWEDQLQRTMSPKKRDRQYLREIQKSAKALNEPQEDFVGTPFKRSMLGRSALGQSYLAQKSTKKVGFGTSTMQIEPADLGKSQAFRTSMDIMNSLWSQEKSGKTGGFAAERSFEV